MNRRPPNSLLLLVLGLAAIGCGLPPPPSNFAPASSAASGERDAEGLVVMTGGTILVGDRTGLVRPIDGPPGRPESVSASAGRVLVQVEGPAFVVAAVDPSTQRPVWEPVEIAVDELRHPVSSPSLSPSGRKLALLSADVGGGGTFESLIIDLDQGGQGVIPIQREANGPPVWLDESRLLLEVVPSLDGSRFVILDLPTANTDPAPGQGIGPAVSGDGSVVAVQQSDGVVVTVPTGNWLATDPPEGAEHVGAPRATFALALDMTGARIAVGYVDASGEPTSIDVYRRDATGWARTSTTVPLVAGTRTSFDWLR